MAMSHQLGYPSRCWCRRCPMTLRSMKSGLQCFEVRRLRSGPQRGDRRQLLETVTHNAREEFVRHRMRRASDHNTRSRALAELQDALQLRAPLRIECYDMAHLQGTDYVGSMVVLEDGMPAKKEYRRFKVNIDGNDDYAAMEEVLTRRLQAYLDERDQPIEERGENRSSRTPPQLLVVDGGKGQLGVAERVVNELGLADEIPVAALAKRFEEVLCRALQRQFALPVVLRRCLCCNAFVTRHTGLRIRSTVSDVRSG